MILRGFFGKCLLESFIYINERLHLDGKIIALSRNSSAFLQKHPEFINDSIVFIDGDITSFLSPQGKIDYIIHAAHDFAEDILAQPITERTDIIGAKRILDFATEKQVKAILFTSSGAVYYDMIRELRPFSENDYNCAQYMPSKNSYADNKRFIESMLYEFGTESKFTEVKIARCFAFVGRHFPLDKGYAIGNFMDNILNGKEILVKSDGSAKRSYLYSADMCVWLWRILFSGANCRAYNVGSDVVLSVKNVAEAVAKRTNANVYFEYDKNVDYSNWYVPSVERSRDELGLDIFTHFEDAVNRSFDFFSQKKLRHKI